MPSPSRPCLPSRRKTWRTPSGIEELDRVLGGGVVEGGVVLIGGDPGIGKSTLLLQAMDALQRAGLPTLYVTGEESGAQVALRSRRLGIDGSQVNLLAEIQLEKILATVEADAAGRGGHRLHPDHVLRPAHQRPGLGRRRCANAPRTSRAWPRARA